MRQIGDPDVYARREKAFASAFRLLMLLCSEMRNQAAVC